MDNLGWLKKIKKEDGIYMNLDKDERNKIGWQPSEYSVKYRRTKALEIIAEELCKLNTKSDYNRLEEE